MTSYKILNRGFSLVEMMVVVAIVGSLAAIFIATLAGSKGTDSVDRAVQQIYDDLVSIRSKAVSVNKSYRLHFTTTSNWRIEVYDDVAGAWNVDSEARTMPGNTYLTQSSFTNAGSNLSSTPRGLFVFAGTAVGTPYVTVTGLGVENTKSLYVYVGGAIDKQTP